jgi:hypothetical protein
MARMQLGKRLEQVLMDKEEALDQLEVLRVSYLCSGVRGSGGTVHRCDGELSWRSGLYLSIMW